MTNAQSSVGDEAERPLEGVRVLDLSQYVSGPFCTKLLGQHGASVVKVEAPGGDPVSHWPPLLPDNVSLLYVYLNHAKDTLTLDLSTPEGRDRVLEMAKTADVVVENFQPGTLDGYGLGWSVLHEVNPALVLTSISGFGQEGPYRDFKSWDIIADAMGGLSYIHGLYDRQPLTHGNPQAQYRSGVVAASATVAALMNLDGEGEHVDISMMEVVSSALRDTVPQYTFMGAVRRRSGRREGGPGAITAALDGYVIPSAYGGGDWSNFARFLEAPELDDERFATGDGRQLHAAELREIMARVIARWKMIDFLEGAQAWGLGVGAVMTPKQVMESSHWNERDFFEKISRPVRAR